VTKSLYRTALPFSILNECLADGVAYAAKDLGADVILDICTLTGAQVRSAHTEQVSRFIATNLRGLPKLNLVMYPNSQCSRIIHLNVADPDLGSGAVPF
jgi:hypothetical protein